MLRKERLDRILYHLGKGIWKQIPVLGPIVEEVFYEANRDLLLQALEEGSEGLSDQDLAQLEKVTRSFEQRLADTLANEFSGLRDRLGEMEGRLLAPQPLAMLETCNSLFANLGLALSNYYAASLALRLSLQAHTERNPDLQSYIENPLTAELEPDVMEVRNQLSALSDALGAVHRDSFASACWRRSASACTSLLADLKDKLIQHGFPELEVAIDLGDLASLSQFAAIAATRLSSPTFAEIVAPTLATNASDQAGLEYDHAALRNLVYAGNLLYLRVAESRAEAGTDLVASFGTAILVDVIDAVSGDDVAVALLKERYPHVHKELDAASPSLDRDGRISSTLAYAVAALKSRPGLLLLQLSRHV